MGRAGGGPGGFGDGGGRQQISAAARFFLRAKNQRRRDRGQREWRGVEWSGGGRDAKASLCLLLLQWEPWSVWNMWIWAGVECRATSIYIVFFWGSVSSSQPRDPSNLNAYVCAREKSKRFIRSNLVRILTKQMVDTELFFYLKILCQFRVKFKRSSTIGWKMISTKFWNPCFKSF
jgi:hypothetical protein